MYLSHREAIYLWKPVISCDEIAHVGDRRTEQYLVLCLVFNSDTKLSAKTLGSKPGLMHWVCATSSLVM